MAKEILEYNGEQYTRRNGKWVDSRCMVVCDITQNELNKLFAEKLDPKTLTVDQCIAEGDNYKNSASIWLALKFYEEAILRSDRRTLSYILPRITSCYRKNGCPQKAIDVLTYASNKFGNDLISHVLLTSAAGAYCDLKDYRRALKCCDQAYAKSNGNPSEELSLVYKRIRKESSILDP